MPAPPIIAPVPASTPARPTSPAGRSARPLPADLLRDAARRLGVMSLVGAGLWTVASGLWHLATLVMSPGDQPWLGLGVPDLIALIAVIASVLLFAYTRQPDGDPRRILDLGLAYLVLAGVASAWGSTGTPGRWATASSRRFPGSAPSC